MPCSAVASVCARCSSMRRAMRWVAMTRSWTHRPARWRSSTPIRWCTTIFPRWTTTRCAVAGPPATSCSARPWRSSPATRCKHWRSRSSPRHTAAVTPSQRIAMLRTLGAACGAEGMAGGQAFDLSGGRPASLARRTGAHACLQDGCADPGVDPPWRARRRLLGCRACSRASNRYGHAVGLAFQVRDDILDVEGESAVIGKTAGKDAAADKPTFPSIIGLDASRVRLAGLVDEALEAIAPLGERGEWLADLARYSAHARPLISVSPVEGRIKAEPVSGRDDRTPQKPRGKAVRRSSATRTDSDRYRSGSP